MQDLLFESIALRRIALFTKLVSRGGCSGDEKDVALEWLGELTADLQNKLDEYDEKCPHSGGVSRGGCGFK